MMSIQEQLNLQVLVCPHTHVPLHKVNDYLETIDGKNKYSVVREIPILFTNASVQQDYLAENEGQMNEEYSTRNTKSFKDKLLQFLAKDFKSKTSVAAFNLIFNNLPDNALCLAIGGGPRRHHEKLINLNIGPFKNVDVVADAYKLPYANNSVDAIYIEAVLEHLEFPETAVKEMFRVLKEGGKVYSDSPLMEGFHGYPNHFQNFTIEGHKRLYARNGFSVQQFGTSVGPTYALFAMITSYIKYYIPFSILKYPLLAIFYALAVVLKPLDLIINKKDESHLLATTTYIYSIKSKAAQMI